MTIACICCGLIEVPLLLGILGAIIAGWRKLRRMCDKNGCKCSCHDMHDAQNPHGVSGSPTPDEEASVRSDV